MCKLWLYTSSPSVVLWCAFQNLDGSVVASWEGIRIQAIATHPTSELVYAADTHNRIRQYNFRDKSSATLLVGGTPLTL